VLPDLGIFILNVPEAIPFERLIVRGIIRRDLLQSCHLQCVRKVALQLQKVLEVMSMSVYEDLNRLTLSRRKFLLNFSTSVFKI
jgi:hypothetical protein